MATGLFKDLCGRGTNASRPAPTGTDRQYYDGYLYEQTDTVGTEPKGFYRYDGVNFLWRLQAIHPDALSPAFETLTDGATITWAFANERVRNATVTLGGNRTLAFTGILNGATGVLIVKQDGTGSRTLTLPAGSVVIGGGGGAVTLTTTANAGDVLSFYYDGTNYWWTYGKNFT